MKDHPQIVNKDDVRERMNQYRSIVVFFTTERSQAVFHDQMKLLYPDYKLHSTKPD
jgi:hypothetical protein